MHDHLSSTLLDGRSRPSSSSLLLLLTAAPATTATTACRRIAAAAAPHRCLKLSAAVIPAGVVHEGWPRPEPQQGKHLRIIVSIVVGRCQEFVAVKDAVGPGHEGQGLLSATEVQATGGEADYCPRHHDACCGDTAHEI